MSLLWYAVPGLLLALVLYRLFSRRALVTLEDALACPGGEVRIHAEVEWPIYPPLDPPLSGIPVEVEVGSQRLPAAPTDASGIVEFPFQVDHTGILPLRASLTTSSRWRSRVVEARLHVLSSSHPLLICDIDKTISAASHLVATFGPNPILRPIPEAREVLERLSERFQIVYLSARDHMFFEKTRRWLRKHGFPEGPLFLRRIRFWSASPERHKELRLAEILHPFSGPKVGIGDRLGDARAYLASGVHPILFGCSAPAELKGKVDEAPTWRDVEMILEKYPTGQPDRFYAE